MNILMAIVTGLIIATGLYLMMGKRLLHLLLGVALLGNGVNMMIVTAAGLTPDSPPLIPMDKTANVKIPFPIPIPPTHYHRPWCSPPL